ncbi:hypothetical protein A8F94_03245 [Bacillus sp. FJAT-27225]|uniref:YpoC family protein n=1 Tax=Bacillus sp. FJAT-27225 TaxID=1743144 RepID=UPI00080C3355|nr:hypothetical protein [Bacillus sp. FJAT-27225]OCA90897.1 hypothetical protein A8F94_03245 [Bacillus sp. FJAT-27225]
MRKDNRCIPNELDHPFFEGKAVLYFPEEATFYCGKEGERPWHESKTSVISLVEQWPQTRESIELAFKERNKPMIRESMKAGLSILLKCLYWGNSKPVLLTKLDQVEDLAIRPINCKERIEFLFQRPELFHSYIQLNQLLDEQKKHFMKSLAIKKGSTS